MDTPKWLRSRAMSEKISPPRPAVFLDRDGTIIEDRGDLSDPSQVEFFEGTIPALRRLGERFGLFIVTNQSGVAKGAITTQDVERVNAHILSRLSEAGIEIVAAYVCPHERRDGCRCMKPSPLFLHRAEHDHGVDLRRSFAIGDHPHDVEFARAGGATGIYVLSGHGLKHLEGIAEGTAVVAGIREAAELILESETENGT
ncbi:MAG: HAD family hydrolase [Candidatus Aminicenantes bacterium]|nr:HAD family hydrolase [Candidatus Aminicenantes bacterium]